MTLSELNKGSIREMCSFAKMSKAKKRVEIAKEYNQKVLLGVSELLLVVI
jgi:F0F1-type ATP synthase gamma subunit